MDVFTMVVALVAIGTVAKIADRRMKHRAAAAAHSTSASEDASLQREIAALRDRVATLEKIVTEPAYDLRRQIQDLETRRAA